MRSLEEIVEMNDRAVGLDRGATGLNFVKPVFCIGCRKYVYPEQIACQDEAGDYWCRTCM